MLCLRVKDKPLCQVSVEHACAGLGTGDLPFPQRGHLRVCFNLPTTPQQTTTHSCSTRPSPNSTGKEADERPLMTVALQITLQQYHVDTYSPTSNQIALYGPDSQTRYLRAHTLPVMDH